MDERDKFCRLGFGDLSWLSSWNLEASSSSSSSSYSHLFKLQYKRMIVSKNRTEIELALYHFELCIAFGKCVAAKRAKLSSLPLLRCSN